MKNKKFLPILLVLFVLLLIGASMLYNHLIQNTEANQMIVHTTQQPSAELVVTPDVNATTAPDFTEEPSSQDETSTPSEQDSSVFFAPDFHVYDRSGNVVRLSDFFGKPIVLNFWASWCGPCQSEMPDFNEKYAELGDDIHFLMVNMTSGRETMAVADAFIERSGYSFPVFYDLHSEAAIIYEVYSLPTTYFINAEGHLIAQAIGAIDSETLQIGIDMITE